MLKAGYAVLVAEYRQRTSLVLEVFARAGRPHWGPEKHVPRLKPDATMVLFEDSIVLLVELKCPQSAPLLCRSVMSALVGVPTASPSRAHVRGHTSVCDMKLAGSFLCCCCLLKLEGVL